MMNKILWTTRVNSEGRGIFLPSLFVALFMVLSGCGTPDFEESVIIREGNGAGALTSQEEVTQNDINDSETHKSVSETATDGLDEVPQAGKKMVVHICGAVEHPGVYELEEESRIIDAVAVAGGFSEGANADAVNLASYVYDSSRVYIPAVGESVTEAEIIENADSEGDTLININTASEGALTRISGIGATKAKSIITYREEHGRFQSKEDIKNVSGIGEGTYQKIKDQISVN